MKDVTRPTQRTALRTLTVQRLGRLCDQFAIDRERARRKHELIEKLARSRRVTFQRILDALSRAELQTICRRHQLDGCGEARSGMIARILTDETDEARASRPRRARSSTGDRRETDAPRARRRATTPSSASAPPSAARDAASTRARLENFGEKAAFLWSVAELLRGDFKPSEYGRVILPFTVIRRLDQALAPTRDAVREAQRTYASAPDVVRERELLRASGLGFYNQSELDVRALLRDPARVAANLRAYARGFSGHARDVVEHFRFDAVVERLDRAGLCLMIVQKFAAVDLHPDRVSNLEMGYIFEELIRRFSEPSSERAGEHFTPREVIRLMVNLLFVEDDEALREPDVTRTMLDPACGTGGMLSVAEEYLRERNPGATLRVYGQELNGESYAVCKADMLLKGQDADNIRRGNSFTEDRLAGVTADYLISNPPFGVDWTKAAAAVRREHETLGHAGRFGPGLPRKSDGSLLFLLHMLAKMKPPEQGGSRLAVVLNGSPLFAGAAGSGESEIRRYLLERDLLEAIIALPDQLFYNTGIHTYLWVVSNRKPAARRGKVQLVNGVNHFRKLRRSLGDKRKELSPGHIAALTRLYADFTERPEVKIIDNEAFGFRRVTVERPLKVNVQVSEARVARLEEERGWTHRNGGRAAVTAETRAAVTRALARLDQHRVYKRRDAFVADLEAAATALGVTLPASLVKTVLSALSERDETAEVCRARGRPEPDPELRDHERVPLRDDIDAYVAREVLPHAPDAWVDRSKTKVGYEIPFARYFYESTPPRPLAVIEAEIRTLEREIHDLLGEVFADVDAATSP